MLGVGVVHGDDGKLQHAFLRHRAQANHAGRGFFGAADHAFESVGALGVQNRDQVGAIVHGDVRLVIDGGQDVVVVGVVVLALDGEDRNALIAHQAGGNIVLGRERIRGAQHHVGAAVAQADGQVRGLGRNVQAGRDANALQRLVLDEFFADNLQHLHGLVRPLDALLAQFGQFQALDIAIDLCCC